MSSSIDSLSDDVICHILSFLPTRISASTNVLSKRWRFLWAHVPNLYFKGDDFEDEAKTSDIITRVIVLHRTKPINTFRLFDDVSCSDYQLATWITHAVNCAVRNLYLDFSNPDDVVDSFTPPRCLLVCNTLVDLKLRCCRLIPSSGKVFLPSLKKLHLSHFTFEDDESLPRLLSGCPVLEDLIVEGCFKDKQFVSAFDVDVDDDLGCVFVSSPTIKTLNVDLLDGFPKLKINAPSLVYLKVNNCFLEDITCLGTMTSLIEADLYLNIEQDPYEYDEKCILYDTQFLICLCNLKCLRISMEFLETVLINIATLSSSLVKFDNLTKLELHLFSLDFHDLVKFLQFADNLESLCFTLGGIFYTYKEPKQVPTCMLSRLKIVRIKPFLGFNEHVFETIRFLLRNAQVLKRMEIYSNSNCSSNEVELEMLGRISLLERGSESCELAFF